MQHILQSKCGLHRPTCCGSAQTTPEQLCSNKSPAKVGAMRRRRQPVQWQPTTQPRCTEQLCCEWGFEPIAVKSISWNCRYREKAEQRAYSRQNNSCCTHVFVPQVVVIGARNAAHGPLARCQMYSKRAKDKGRAVRAWRRKAALRSSKSSKRAPVAAALCSEPQTNPTRTKTLLQYHAT